jgi:hypothetical protein
LDVVADKGVYTNSDRHQHEVFKSFVL